MQVIQPSTPEAFQLIMEGQAALCDVEAHGMRIDEAYLDRALERTTVILKQMEQRLFDDEIFRLWRKRFGLAADLGKSAQLATVLFQDLGLTPKSYTKTRDKKGNQKPAMDEEALEDIDYPFVKRYVTYNKLKKARNTYLVGIKRECHNGYVHPSFNLHLASTWRSSCDGPNLQNQPVRDPRQAELIRQAFIPRSDEYMLVEIDYAALEFKGCANHWQDPDMIRYASDPSLDIHRDMAAECYCLSLDQVSKPCRSMAKNGFVFPVLYGSTHKACSRNLWQQIGRSELKRVDGMPIYEHLRQQGITEMAAYAPDGSKLSNTYESHIQRVEQQFHKRFPEWSTQRDIWWNQYLERGWFPLASGFVAQGVFSFNNLMNTPSQGACFHIVLWSLTQINKELKRRKMKSKLICTIHDSIVADVYLSELDDYLGMCKRIMTEDVRKHFPWIMTTLGVEAEASAVSWFHKSKVEIQ